MLTNGAAHSYDYVIVGAGSAGCVLAALSFSVIAGLDPAIQSSSALDRRIKSGDDRSGPRVAWSL
jgi:hypothetical protein